MSYFLLQIIGLILSVLTDSVLGALVILVYFLSNLFEHRNDAVKLQQLKKKTFILIGIFVGLKLLVIIFGPIAFNHFMNNMTSQFKWD